MNIDIERLRHDLLNYFGSAVSINSMAIINVFEVETASYDKLIQIAEENNFNLDNYIAEPYTRNLFK